MEKDEFVFFLPTRKGSERVKNKNTRTFADIEGGILAIKIGQLLKVKKIHRIIVSTNDPLTIEVAESFQSPKIEIKERPEELCLSTTVIEDFINYIPTVANAKHIFWVHATAPMVNENIYNSALEAYIENVIDKKRYDSLLSVSKIQQFLWSDKEHKCINHDRSIIKWPRTQDLEPLYEINHAFYINSIDNYHRLHDRIGINPFLFELDKIHSFDIDWEDDFKIAEVIYKNHIS